MRIYYCVEALDNLVISKSHLVSFTNESLDYIPGSVISGALASRMYLDKKVDNSELFTLFQNNSCNFFSNAYPAAEDSNNPGKYVQAFPIPMSLHYEKGQKPVKGNLINQCNYNDDNKSAQYKQVRSGYMNSNLDYVNVEKGGITRTAINFESQSAAESTLHTLNYISAGTIFWGYAEFENKYESIFRNFLNGSEIRVGKSRGSEFGRIRLNIINDNLTPVKPKVNSDGFIYLWCLSDCQFIDIDNSLDISNSTGQLTSVPNGYNLWSLSEKYPDMKIEYQPQKSFIRTINKRYFNRKRGGLDGERMQITRGSVLCFKINSSVTTEDLAELQLKGIGLERQYGLGQVIVNPEWIIENKPEHLFAYKPFSVNKIDELSSDNRLNPNLIEYLKNLHRNYNDQIDFSSDDEHLKEVIKLYKKIRMYNSIKEYESFGPTATQWRDVFAKVKSNDFVEDIKKITFENIAKDIDPESASNKKETQDQELQSWAARLLTADKKPSFFAKEYIAFIKGMNYTKEHMLYNLEKLTKIDLSKFKNLEDK